MLLVPAVQFFELFSNSFVEFAQREELLIPQRRNNPGFHQTNRRCRSAFVLRLADTRQYDCVTEINDHLFEGRYSPKWPDGKKHARNVYAHTREECEEKLKVLIIEMKTELAELKKQKAKETLQPQAPEGKKGRKKSKKAKKDK